MHCSCTIIVLLWTVIVLLMHCSYTVYVIFVQDIFRVISEYIKKKKSRLENIECGGVSTLDYR